MTHTINGTIYQSKILNKFCPFHAMNANNSSNFRKPNK
jgi:hypothetical protein